MKKFKIREQVIIYISIPFAILMGTVLLSIYFLTENNRKQEFYQRLKDRTTTTLRLLVEVQEIDIGILRALDRNTINNLYEEKILIFNDHEQLIYSSVDDTRITYPQSILTQLRSGQNEIETHEGAYEVVGIRFTHEGKSYYGIAKALDLFGKKKMNYIKWVLIIAFIVSSFLIILMAVYLSRAITAPIKQLASSVQQNTSKNLFSKINVPARKDEIGVLTDKFNELLNRLESAFMFQRNFIQHISHELKTPLAIMLTNVERTLADENPESWKESLQFQRATTMEIAHVINALIDISKVESADTIVLNQNVRMDEVIFECIEEIGYLDPAISFNCILDDSITTDHQLTVMGNKRMLKLAMLNILKNAIYYSTANNANIHLSYHNGILKIQVENDGKTLAEDEQKFLFVSIFRGGNTGNKKGFGMGLFLSFKIVQLHDGDISYFIGRNGTNIFQVTLQAF